MNIFHPTVGIAILIMDLPVFDMHRRPDRRPITNQRTSRKNRRRRWAAGDKKAFKS